MNYFVTTEILTCLEKCPRRQRYYDMVPLFTKCTEHYVSVTTVAT